MGIKRWFKANDTTQNCLVRTESDRIEAIQLEIKKGCAVDMKRMEAYVLDAENMIRNYETGEIFQLITERSVAPIPVQGRANKEFTKETKNAIGRETIHQELQRIERENAKNNMVTKLMLLVSIPCVTVLIVVCATLMQRMN